MLKDTVMQHEKHSSHWLNKRDTNEDTPFHTQKQHTAVLIEAAQDREK